MRTPEVIVQRLDVNAKLPAKPKSLFDAGWDVYPLYRSVIPKKGDGLIGTGLKLKIPNGYCIQVNPRSGKAVKNKLVVGARVIDAPYRGELKIHIFNHSDEDYEVSPHDPIAQLLILPCGGIMHEGFIEDITERGEDGFGSTDGDLKYASMHAQPLKSQANMLKDTVAKQLANEQKGLLSHQGALTFTNKEYIYIENTLKCIASGDVVNTHFSQKDAVFILGCFKPKHNVHDINTPDVDWEELSALLTAIALDQASNHTIRPNQAVALKELVTVFKQLPEGMFIKK